MKVVRRQEWKFKFVCKGCKSHLVAEADDVKVGYYGGSYCESGTKGYYVSCPVCGKEEIISTKDVPYIVTSKS